MTLSVLEESAASKAEFSTHPVDHILSLACGDRPNDPNLPSVEHCVGTKRLLGEHFGCALAEALGIRDREQIRELTALSILLRAYLVLDDYLVDRYCDPYSHRYAKQWRDNIALAARERLKMSFAQEEAWMHALTIYQTSNLREYASGWDLVMDKCSFVFLLFDLPILQNERGADKIKEVVANYLFALQVCDDHKDLHEDLGLKTCNNLFFRGMNRAACQEIASKKWLIQKTVALYLIENLSGQLKALSRPTSILGRYLHSGIQKLRAIAGISPTHLEASFGGCSFREFDQRWQVVHSELSRCADRFERPPGELSAELVHTLRIRRQSVS